MNRYDPRTPRVFAGFAAAVLTVATLATTVMAPAALDAQQDATAIAAGGEDHVYANAGPVTTSIDVVAYRVKRAPIIQSRANVRAGSAS